MFISSASEWHFHLSSPLIGSSAHVPIGVSASSRTRDAFTFFTHTHIYTHTPHICLYVFTASLYNDSRSFALTFICISSQPTQSLRPLLKHQKKHREEKMWRYLNENKSSKTMLQTLCSWAISALPRTHPVNVEPKIRGKRCNYFKTKYAPNYKTTFQD